MFRKLVPAILPVVGLGIGVGLGLFLRPATPVAQTEGEQTETEAAAEAEPVEEPEYVKLNNQFVVPVLQDGKVISMVILSLSLEIKPGMSQEVYSREPKLRDLFLQVLFDHANAGGFQGSFTDGANLVLLRKTLLEAASIVMDDVVHDVLISDIARQDS
jgi:flagellar basal body-associated protein FliL